MGGRSSVLPRGGRRPNYEQIAGNVKSWVGGVMPGGGVVGRWCQPGGRGCNEDYRFLLTDWGIRTTSGGMVALAVMRIQGL